MFESQAHRKIVIRRIGILLGIFASLRVVPWLTYRFMVLFSDSRIYLMLAKACASGMDNAVVNPGGADLRGTLYPALLSLLANFHLSFSALAAFQSLIGFLSGLVIFWMARRYLADRSSYLIAALYWISPAVLLYEYAVMPESLFIAALNLCLLLLFCLLEDEEGPSPWIVAGLAMATGCLISLRPAGKIFLLIFIAAFFLIRFEWLRRLWIGCVRRKEGVVALLCLALAARFLSHGLKSHAIPTRSVPAPLSVERGLPSILATTLAPVLDFAYPPLQANPTLRQALENSRQSIENQARKLGKYRIPGKDGGNESFNIQFWTKQGLVEVVYGNRELLNAPPGTFLQRWAWYSISRSPVHFLTFLVVQAYNSVVMLSGSFLDESPNLVNASYGTLVPAATPLSDALNDDRLAAIERTKPLPSQRFIRYYQSIFDTLRFKKMPMFLFRLSLLLAILSILIRSLRAVLQHRFGQFLATNRFPVLAVLILLGHAFILPLLAPVVGRYHVPLLGLALIFVFQQGAKAFKTD